MPLCVYVRERERERERENQILNKLNNNCHKEHSIESHGIGNFRTIGLETLKMSLINKLKA